MGHQQQHRNTLSWSEANLTKLDAQKKHYIL